MREPGLALAILGATPEIRSLARRHRLRCVCVDVNRDVFTALSAMTVGAGGEDLREANWLEIDDEGAFDVIVGDGSLNMLPPAHHARLLDRIASALRPGGRALLRVHLVGPSPYADPASVVAAYRSRAIPASFWTWTRTHFDMLWKDAEDAVRFDSLHRRVHELFRDRVISAEEYAAYESVASTNGITLHYARRDRFERLAAERFEIVSVTHGEDYEASHQHPVFALVRRD